MSAAPGAVLVTGATGTVGRSLVQALLAAAQHVRAGVRDPDGANLPDAAGVLSAELGRRVTYLNENLWRRRDSLHRQGLDPSYIWVQLIIDITTRLGLAGKVTGDIPLILGRPATTLAQFVHDHRDAWESAGTDGTA